MKVRWKGTGADVEGVGLTLRGRHGDWRWKRKAIELICYGKPGTCAGMKRCLRPLAPGEEGWMDGLIDVAYGIIGINYLRCMRWQW